MVMFCVNVYLIHHKNVLFLGHNHQLTTGTDEPTLWLLPEHQQEVASIVVTWWRVAFLHSVPSFMWHELLIACISPQ